MLRRMSVHAADPHEAPETYVWENLRAADFELGAAASFGKEKRTRKLREYAIAGVLHMDHLATLTSSAANRGVLDTATFHLARSLNLTETETRERLVRMLQQHEREWRSFLTSLGPESFVTRWTGGAG